MIIDAMHVFSDKQTISETGNSANVVELPVGMTSGVALSLMVVVRSEGGSSPTLKVELEASSDGITFAPLLVLDKPAAVSTFGIDLDGVPLRRYLRLRYVIGGSSPVYSITAMLQSGMSFGRGSGLYPASPRTA